MSSVKTIIESGSEGVIVTVECSLANSLPNIVIIGMASRSVGEAKDRIRGALASSGIKLPVQKITINLSPSDVIKQGSHFDLPMLITLLAAADLISSSLPTRCLVMGEVGLDGSIRPIRGVIGKILMGKKHGYTEFWIPDDNLQQANLIPGVLLRSFKNVRELYAELNGLMSPRLKVSSRSIVGSTRKPEFTLDEIIGQEQAKRALLIAAAGHHNIMLSGPPGSGKSMLARALPSLLPNMSMDEQLEVTHLHSLASKNFDKIISARPFRTPHNTSSLSSILGGGNVPSPGEVSLSHKGILFFDEFTEYRRGVIEALRQPLEDKFISLSSRGESIKLPADFLFIAACNPCPCGYLGDNRCDCSIKKVIYYQSKISGPIIDRIDMHISVNRVKNLSLTTNSLTKNTTISMQAMVKNARKTQFERQHKLNNRLQRNQLNKVCDLANESKQLLQSASDKLGLSARGHIRTLRLARTIADLEATTRVETKHLIEALQYRQRTFV